MGGGSEAKWQKSLNIFQILQAYVINLNFGCPTFIEANDRPKDTIKLNGFKWEPFALQTDANDEESGQEWMIPPTSERIMIYVRQVTLAG